jgi:HPt (histidine-containing phosphotransfer) domain-containing protein
MTPPGDLDAVYDPAALERLQQLDPQGRKQLMARVVAAFEASLHKTLGELAVARREGDAAALRRLAHTLKSSAASMGALALAQACAELEAQAHAALGGAAPEGAGLGGDAALADRLQAAQDRLALELDRALRALPVLQPAPAAAAGGGAPR